MKSAPLLPLAGYYSSSIQSFPWGMYYIDPLLLIEENGLVEQKPSIFIMKSVDIRCPHNVM